MVQDLTDALRTILKTPGFTAVTVLTLAVGIGANAALFSVVDALLLRPLPYPDAGRIVTLWSTQPDGSRTNVSPADFLDYRDRNHVFEHIGALSQVDFNVMISGAADRLTGFRITSGFLETLGVQPLLGRRFTPGDDRTGAPPVVILSYTAWQQKFGGDRQVIGQALTVDGASGTVIGVLPRNFRFIFSPEMLAPLTIDTAASRTDRILCPIAKINRGLTFAQARRASKGWLATSPGPIRNRCGAGAPSWSTCAIS